MNKIKEAIRRKKKEGERKRRGESSEEQRVSVMPYSVHLHCVYELKAKLLIGRLRKLL